MLDVPQLLMFGTPVALAALGETVGQKSGVINIGLEGVMLGAAFSAMIASQASGSAYIGLAAGAGVGLAIALFQVVFVVRLALDQVVVGTAINLLAMGATSTLFRMRYGVSGRLLSVPGVPTLAFGIDAVVIFCLICVALTGWMLTRTKWGLAVRATGEYPAAVEAAGYSALALRRQAMLIGGLLAGLGGAYLSLGIAGSFAENMTAGRGFVAIAMVTFGRWKPLYVYGAALLVGYAESLQYVFQARGTQVPFQLFIALPYLLALAVLVVAGKGAAVPASLGRPHRPEADS